MQHVVMFSTYPMESEPHMNFKAHPKGYRTSKGPIYLDAESGYTIAHDSPGWYFRDETGFIGGDKFATLREAKREAAEWRKWALAR